MKNIIDFFGALFTDIFNFFKTAPGFGGPITSGQMIILAIALGFAACAVGSYLNGLFLGKFVSEILKAKAENPESAVALEANIFVKQALKSGGAFGKIVRIENGENSEAKYYIEPKNASRAENLYSKNGANPVSLIITLVFLLIVAATAYVVIPELLNMTSNFAESIKPESNIA